MHARFQLSVAVFVLMALSPAARADAARTDLPQYQYVNRAPGTPLDPKLEEFLRYVLSRQGQEIVARTGGYLPLTAVLAREQLKKLDAVNPRSGRRSATNRRRISY